MSPGGMSWTRGTRPCRYRVGTRRRLRRLLVPPCRLPLRRLPLRRQRLRLLPRRRWGTAPSAYADAGTGRPCILATCWAQEASGHPTVPARAMNKETQATVDTGSVVTLLRPDLAGGREGPPMEVTCVHGDTRTYGTCHVVVRTPQGVFTARAGIVPRLPVPLLIGRDCPIFRRFWDPARASRGRRDAAADDAAGDDKEGQGGTRRDKEGQGGTRRRRSLVPTRYLHGRVPLLPGAWSSGGGVWHPAT